MFSPGWRPRTAAIGEELVAAPPLQEQPKQEQVRTYIYVYMYVWIPPLSLSSLCEPDKYINT